MFLNGDTISLQLHHCFFHQDSNKKRLTRVNKQCYCLVELLSHSTVAPEHIHRLSKPIKIAICPTIMSIDNEKDTLSFTINSTVTFNLNQVHSFDIISIKISFLESKLLRKDKLFGSGHIEIPNNITPNMDTVLSVSIKQKDNTIGSMYSALTLMRRCVSGSYPMISSSSKSSRMYGLMDMRAKTMNNIHGGESKMIYNTNTPAINTSLSRISTSSGMEIVDEESGLIFKIPGMYEKCGHEYMQSNQFCDTISTFLFKNISLKDRDGKFTETDLDQIKLQMFVGCEQSFEQSNMMMIHKMIRQDQVSAFLNFEASETRSSFGQHPLNFMEHYRNRQVKKNKDSSGVLQSLLNEWSFFNQSLNRMVKVQVLVMCMSDGDTMIVIEHRTTITDQNQDTKILEDIAPTIYMVGSKEFSPTPPQVDALLFEME